MYTYQILMHYVSPEICCCTNCNLQALEKRNRLEEDTARQHIQWNEDSPQPVDPTTPVHAEHSDPDSQSTQTQETLSVVASGRGSTSAVANSVTSVA